MRVQFSSFQAERVRELRQRFAAQPSWVVRAALITFGFIVILPIVLLVAIAFLAALMVLSVLGLINRLGRLLTGRGGSIRRRRDSAGRKNVKILSRAG